MSPNGLLDKSFRLRGLSKSLIQKVSLRTEVEIKAKGLALRTPNATRKATAGLPEPRSLDDIHAVSKTVTHKQVSPCNMNHLRLTEIRNNLQTYS